MAIEKVDNRGRHLVRPKYHFSRDLHHRAYLLGYPGPQTAMFFEYHAQGKNLNQVGESLGITGMAVRAHLVKMGFPLRRRGGNHINPGIRTVDSFLIKCRMCRKLFTARSWVVVLGEMKGHRC